jgi:hypothetical protein
LDLGSSDLDTPAPANKPKPKPKPAQKKKTKVRQGQHQSTAPVMQPSQGITDTGLLQCHSAKWNHLDPLL